MPAFAYKAINENGEVVKGLIEVSDIDNAYESITSKGLNILTIKPSSGVMEKYLKGLKSMGIKTIDVIEFAKNLSVMLRAGLPLVNSINDIAFGADNKRFAAILKEISGTVELGSSFSEALESHKNLFPELFINLVGIGEETGSLGDSLADIAIHLERMEDLKSAIIRALMYPAFALVGTFGALLFWLIYVLPKMTGLFKTMSVELPPLTKALIIASDFSVAYWYVYFVVPVILFIIYKLLSANKKTLYYVDMAKLKLPVFKLITYNKLVALFAEQLRILVAAGVTIDKSFDIMVRVIENEVFRRVLNQIKEDIVIGSDLSAAMEKHGNIFPNMALRMISIGESTGRLQEQLDHLSEYFLKKLDEISQKMGKLIEPLIIMFVGGMFMIIILGLLAPIYDLIAQVVTMDFLNYFGLKEDPFKLTPDTSYFYPSASHNEGLLSLDYIIDQKEGFSLIIGDPGTGKTTMLKVFLQKWASKAEIAMILTPRLTPQEFLVAVAEDFKISLKDGNKNDIIKGLREFMTQKSLEGKRVIIVVDEAQNLPIQTLEELRLLSNLETEKDKLLQIILIGQPELEDKLKKDRLRQLNQRISARLYLNHFNTTETLDYIKYRVIKAGSEKLKIDTKAGKLIKKLTKGTPRLINMLVSRTLMASYLDKSSIIQPRHIHHAIKSLNHSDLKIQWRYRLMPVSIGLVATAMIMACVYMFTIMVSGENIDASYDSPAAVVKAPVSKSAVSRPSVSKPAVSRKVNRVKRITVVTDSINVRTRPSLYAKTAGWALAGEVFEVLGQTRDAEDRIWYHVAFKGGRHWISERVVEGVK